MYLCAGQDLLANLLLDLMQFCIIIVHLHLDDSRGLLAQSTKGSIEDCITLDVQRTEGSRSFERSVECRKDKISENDGLERGMEIVADSKHSDLYVSPASALSKKHTPHTQSPSSNRWVALVTADGEKDISRTPPCGGLGEGLEGTPRGVSIQQAFPSILPVPPQTFHLLDCSGSYCFCRFVASALPGLLGWSNKLSEASWIWYGNLDQADCHCSRIQNTAVVLGASTMEKARGATRNTPWTRPIPV